jgi:hypothetical protein
MGAVLLHGEATGANDFCPAHVSFREIGHHGSHDGLIHAAEAHRFSCLNNASHPFRMYSVRPGQYATQGVDRKPALQRQRHGFHQLVVQRVPVTIPGLP